jgi:hypothetical protein
MSYNGMFQVGIHRRIRPVEQPKPFPVSLFSATLKCVHINQRIGGVGGVTVGKPSKIFFSCKLLKLRMLPLYWGSSQRPRCCAHARDANGIVMPHTAAIASQTLLGIRVWLRFRSGDRAELNRKSMGQSALEPDCMLQLACAIERANRPITAITAITTIRGACGNLS